MESEFSSELKNPVREDTTGLQLTKCLQAQIRSFCEQLEGWHARDIFPASVNSVFF